MPAYPTSIPNLHGFSYRVSCLHALIADFFAANGYSIEKHVAEKLMTTTDSEFKYTQKDISNNKKKNRS